MLITTTRSTMRFSFASTLLLCSPVLSQQQTFLATPTDVCPNLACCEDDCCGPQTRWQPPFCIYDKDSRGFVAHSEDHVDECAHRVCCEGRCCGEGTVYDADLGSCVPSETMTTTTTTTTTQTVTDSGTTSTEASGMTTTMKDDVTTMSSPPIPTEDMLAFEIIGLNATMETDEGPQVVEVNGLVELIAFPEENESGIRQVRIKRLSLGTSSAPAKGNETGGVSFVTVPSLSETDGTWNTTSGSLDLMMDLDVSYWLLTELARPPLEDERAEDFVDAPSEPFSASLSGVLSPDVGEDLLILFDLEAVGTGAVLGGVASLTIGAATAGVSVNGNKQPSCPKEKQCDIKTICIQPVFIGTGATDATATGKSYTEMKKASDDIYKKCCIEFDWKDAKYINNNDYKDIKGSTEEKKLLAEQDEKGTNDCIEVFFVETMTNPTTNAKHWGGDGVCYDGETKQAKVIVADDAVTGCNPKSVNLLAHELGHALGDLQHGGGTGTVMEPTGNEPNCPGVNPAKITEAQCKDLQHPDLKVKKPKEKCCKDWDIVTTTTTTTTSTPPTSTTTATTEAGTTTTEEATTESYSAPPSLAPSSTTTTTTATTTTSSTTTSFFDYQLCGLGIVLASVDAVGRLVNETEPNGDQEQPLVRFFAEYRQVDCPFESSSTSARRKLNNEGTTTETYTVEGDNLAQVSVDIFDRKGPILKGKRYAGSAELRYSHRWNYVFDPNRKTLTVTITDVSWSTIILLPSWSAPATAPAAETVEWARFLAALTVHENGHVDIYNEFMAKVKMNVVGQTVTLMNVAKLPELDENNEGKTAVDRAILNQVGDAVEALIQADAEFAKMNTRQDNYDLPKTAGNPIGTDHGKTQDASLDTNP